MKLIDRLLQSWRIAKAASVLHKPAFVLDIGTGNGALFKKLPHLSGVGIDVYPECKDFPQNASYLHGKFPDVPGIKDFIGKFDAAILLAIMEHVREDKQEHFVKAIYRALKPGGIAVLTVPSPMVDPILSVLKFLRLIDGMADEEHYGFDVGKTIPLFERAGFKLLRKNYFQLGLNNFFVFKKE